MKQNKNNRFAALLLALCMAVCCALPALAAPAASANIDLSRTGSMDVTLYDHQNDVPLRGGALTVYKVADVARTNGDLHFVYTADFTGCGIALGDLTINKTVYSEAQLLKPSELTAAIITAGGLIFVDNSDAADLSFTISGASINMGDIVLIGRYPERAQATISGPELRCKYNAAFKNLHIAASGNYNLFTTTNATYDPTLHVEDLSLIHI